VIDQLVAAVDLFDRMKDRYRKWKNPPQESVPSRFVRLFEAHGVHRNQIPRFFGHGIKLSDLHSDDSLLLKLDESMLEDACERFAVRRTWLDGADPQVYPHHDFYKYPSDFARFITNLRADNPDGELSGILVSPSQQALNGQAVLVLQEYIGELGEKPIYRNHLCTGWVFEYWKSRAYLTTCISLAWKEGIYTHGRVATPETISGYADGYLLLDTEEFDRLDRSGWHPEDMALDPAVFLDELDFEKDNYGVRAGLKLWLDLQQEGFMDLGQQSSDARLKFEAELEKYRVDAAVGG
jgi:hypothetical protein